MSYYPPTPPRSRPTSYTPSSPRSHLPARPFLPYSSPAFTNTPVYNPKKISEAAARPAPRRPAPSAPYVHLDFHTNLADSRRPPTDDSICPVNRTAVKFVRWISVFLRLLTLAGAMGLLVCMMFLRKMDNFTTWICRVPPAIAIFHNVYATYHVAGSQRLRTPGSSKMYYLLASTVDLGVVSFYAFIGILAWRQRANPTWTSIFNDRDVEAKLVWGIFLTVCSAGGVMMLALLLQLYLIHVCRRLQHLPPDMNPYAYAEEEKKSKEQEKEEKRWSSSTTTTVDSTAPFLRGEERTVAFQDTRVPPVTGGKYNYAHMDVENVDRRDSRILHGQTESVSSWNSDDEAAMAAANRKKDTPVNTPSKKKPFGSVETEGFSKATLFPDREQRETTRFRHVSGEAH